MEKFKCDAKTAASILEVGNRKITLGNGWKVEAINLNNETCKASQKGSSSSWFDNENIEFFINVPKTAKTVY